MNKWVSSYKRHPERSLFSDLMPVILISITVFIIGIAAVSFYMKMVKPVIDLSGKSKAFLYIRSGSDFGEVVRTLTGKGYLADRSDFEWLSKRKHYTTKVKPGKYEIRDGMTNNELVNMLRSGRQVPVRITIQNIRVPAELAGKLGRQLETDSARFSEIFKDQSILELYEVTPATLLTLFVPNTYEVWWNIPASEFLVRMKQEHDKFWNGDRVRKAGALGLDIPAVVTLASIVEKESNKTDEKPAIAGVYLNRLKRGIPLQADPTVIYAVGDFSIRRVLKRHTEVVSPYNTYQKPGLPPGPICLPSISSIDAVLNAQSHNYLFFCAREDLSGYHNFAENITIHNQNARKYQKALNNLNIK